MCLVDGDGFPDMGKGGVNYFADEDVPQCQTH